MAKKKSTPAATTTTAGKNEGNTVHADASPLEEKMESLKTLNHMLLKETMERREQLAQLHAHADSLVADSELLSLIERDILRLLLRAPIGAAAAELRLLSADKLAAYSRSEKLQSDVERLSNRVRDYAESTRSIAGEKSEVEKALKVALDKKGSIQRELGFKNEQIQELVSKIRQLENDNSAKTETIEELKADHKRLKESDREKEGILQSLVDEKSKLANKLLDSEGSMNRLRKEMEEILSSKEREVESLKADFDLQAVMLQSFEEESRQFKVSNHKLEGEISSCKEIISSLGNEGEKLRFKVREMEKKNSELVDEMKKLNMEREAMLKDMKVKELMFETKIRTSEEKINELSEQIKEIAGVKDAAEKEREQRESQLVESEIEIGKLRSLVADLEESGTVKDEIVARLQGDLDSVQKALGNLRENRDDIKDELIILKQKLCEQEIDKAEKKGEFEKLEKDKLSLENSLFAIQRELDDLKGKMNLFETNSAKSLCLLKNTVEVINGSLESEVDDRKENKDLDPFAVELKSLQIVFKNKTKKIEELNSVIESLRLALADSQKKKGLWTLIYPATATLVAAISFAYAAKGR